MKQIIRINASALKQSACMLKFYRICIEGYKPLLNSNSIEFGSAVHLFLSTMARTGGDFPASLQAAREYFANTKMEIDKKYLDDLKLCSVCTEYWMYLKNNNTFKIFNIDNKPSVEVTFSNKFYEDDNYIVLLEGTIDEIGQIENGCYAIGDYKTTALWYQSYADKKYKMENYFNQHELGIQLKFYLYNLRLKAANEPDSFLAQIANKPIGCFIDAIFHHAKDPTEFKRSRIFFYTQQDMDEMEELLSKFVEKLLHTIKFGHVPLREGTLNGACGYGNNLCNFFNVCAAPGDIARNHILKNSFKQEEYLPIKEKE